MPNFNVLIQPEAEVDLDEAYEYLEEQKSGLGTDLLAQFVDILEILESNPHLFQKIDGQKRRIVIPRFRYNVIFIIKDETVYIIAIFHGNRNPKKWKNRK